MKKKYLLSAWSEIDEFHDLKDFCKNFDFLLWSRCLSIKQIKKKHTFRKKNRIWFCCISDQALLIFLILFSCISATAQNTDQGNSLKRKEDTTPIAKTKAIKKDIPVKKLVPSTKSKKQLRIEREERLKRIEESKRKYKSNSKGEKIGTSQEKDTVN